jgi:hypothetical protein
LKPSLLTGISDGGYYPFVRALLVSALDRIAPGGPEMDRAARILADCEWLPHSFNPVGDALVFARVPEELRRSAAFLDGAAVRPLEKVVLPFKWAQEAAESLPSQPLHFVFHTALCGSTVLVRALEETGSAAGLKEPAILLNLYHRFSRGGDAQEGSRLDLVLKLLGRPLAGTGAVVVKPSCFVNPMIGQLMARSRQSKALLLSSDLRSFLLGIAKRGAEGRSWGRQVFASCRRAIPLEFGFGTEELLQQTDLQVAGLAWLMRRWLFERESAELGPERTLQLESNRLFGDPSATLEAACGFLGLSASERTRSIANGPVFQWHSKENRQYEAADRERDLERVRASHVQEVEPVIRWIEAVARQRGISLAIEASV